MRPASAIRLAGAVFFALTGLAHAEPEAADKMSRRPRAAPSGSSQWSRSGQEELAESFRHHRPKPDEVEAKLRELRATAEVRRDAHRALLRTQFTSATLERQDLRDELAKHARRVAFLNRAKLVATTELDEPTRGAALARIDRLTAKEEARHASVIQRVKTVAAAPAPSRGLP
jgi:hypothetical protein